MTTNEKNDKSERIALIQYLTKEVELHTNLLVSQRTKNNLVFGVGPFVLLGGVAASDSAVLGLQKMSNLFFYFSCAVSVVVFLGLGFIGAKIEEKLWLQCNAWRRSIARISQIDANVGFEFQANGLRAIYMWIFGLIGFLFVFVLFLLKNSL